MTTINDLEFIVTEELNSKPEPRNRKHPYLWQAYLWYMEFLELRKTHLLRISAIERGSSNMDAEFEKEWIQATNLDSYKVKLGKVLANAGSDVGPIWNWITSIKGCKSGLLPAQILAQIDDISRFETISKLWRFAGYAVFDGKAEPKSSFQAPHDKKSGRHYNGMLKGACFNLAETFIKMQTPVYVDVYYNHKIRQRELHPVPACRICQIEAIKKSGRFICPRALSDPLVKDKRHIINYTNKHIHFRAIRKMMKRFLKDLWLKWREEEGLPITEAWEDRS